MVVRPSEAIVGAASSREPADRGQPPGTVQVTLPAHLSFLAAIRTVVNTFIWEVGGSPNCRRELQLAADEAAAILMEDAVPWSEVEVSIAHDDTDVYVRLSIRRADPSHRLMIDELTQMLLDGVVESHEILVDGDRAYAVMQTSRDGMDPDR